MADLATIIQSGNITVSLTVLIVFLAVGYILIFKQNWIKSMQRIREKMGLRYKLKTTEKTNRTESKIIKVIGWIFILVGVLIFLATVYYAIL